MNDSKIKNKICKINEKSLKKFDEIIMDSIIGLTIYNKTDKDMLQRLTLAHISFFIESDFKKFETLLDEKKDLYCKILFDGIYELFEKDEDKKIIKDLIKILYVILDSTIENWRRSWKSRNNVWLCLWWNRELNAICNRYCT